MRRRPLRILLVLALLSGASAIATRPAAGQEPPITFIKVAELNRLLRTGAQVRVVDVRSRQEYLTRHLPGAISVPLDTVEARAGEIPRQGLVVLY
jgi:hypothetical protein